MLACPRYRVHGHRKSDRFGLRTGPRERGTPNSIICRMSELTEWIDGPIKDQMSIALTSSHNSLKPNAQGK